MSKSRRVRKTSQSFQQRYAQWNQNPRVQLTAVLASLCAGIIWVADFRGGTAKRQRRRCSARGSVVSGMGHHLSPHCATDHADISCSRTTKKEPQR